MTIKSTFLGLLTYFLSSVYGIAQVPCLTIGNTNTEVIVPIGTQITLTWVYDPASEPFIDGFYIYRSPRTGNNLDGALGPFTRVAILSNTVREFKLSASKGAYAYFVISYKGTTVSTASNQVKAKWQ